MMLIFFFSILLSLEKPAERCAEKKQPKHAHEGRCDPESVAVIDNCRIMRGTFQVQHGYNLPLFVEFAVSPHAPVIPEGVVVVMIIRKTDDGIIPEEAARPDDITHLYYRSLRTQAIVRDGIRHVGCVPRDP